MRRIAIKPLIYINCGEVYCGDCSEFDFSNLNGELKFWCRIHRVDGLQRCVQLEVINGEKVRCPQCLAAEIKGEE